MRNTTKLKALLLKYSVTLEMSDDGQFTLILIDKFVDRGADFHGGSYGAVLNKAYSHLLKVTKNELRA